MAENYLSDQMKQAGAALIQKMDTTDMRPDAAFWLYDSEFDRWKLVIAQKEVERTGSKKGYRRIRELLQRFSEEIKGLSLDDISLRAPGSRLVAALSHSPKTVPGISGVRLKDHGANGTLIKDVYIYRLP